MVERRDTPEDIVDSAMSHEAPTYPVLDPRLPRDVRGDALAQEMRRHPKAEITADQPLGSRSGLDVYCDSCLFVLKYGHACGYQCGQAVPDVY